MKLGEMLDESHIAENLNIMLPSFTNALEEMKFLILFSTGKVCIRANVAHQAGAYLGFCSIKRLGVFLLPP